MLKDLIKLSNRLDSLGLTKEADFIDSAIRKMAVVIPHYVLELQAALDLAKKTAGYKVKVGVNTYESLGGGNYKSNNGTQVSSDMVEANARKFSNQVKILDLNKKVLYPK